MDKKLLFTMLAMTMTSAIFAQITYESADNGVYDWYATTTWTRLPLSETWAPATPGNPTNSNCNAITVSGYMRVESGGLTVNNANPVITVNDTLYIVGNVTLGSGASLNVAANGILIVTGDLTLEGSFDIANGGNIVVGGNLNVTNGTIQNNEAFYVFGTTSVTGGGTVNGCDGYGNPGGCNPATTGGIGDEVDLQNNNPDLSDFVSGGGVLPVELIFFNCVQKEHEVLIQWVTASQLNFDYFSIEYSPDAVTWNEVGRVKGEVTTQEKMEYSFRVTVLADGKNYYRLKSIDLDDSFEYSRVVLVDVSMAKEFVIYPNPVKSSRDISFSINFTPQEDDFIKIMDMYGSEIVSTSVSSFTNQLNLASLSAGTYLVQYKGVSYCGMVRLIIK